MQGHNARKRRGGQIQTQDRWGVRGLDEARGIGLATLNIRPGRAGRLELDLRALKQFNVDVGVMQETKLIDGVCSLHGAEYVVWASKLDIRHWGLIAVIRREDLG